MRHAVLAVILALAASSVLAQQPQPPVPFRDGGIYGYKDTTGNVVIKPQYSLANEFSEGLAVAAIGAHVGCALYWHLPEPVRGPVLAGSLLAGLVLGAGLVVMLAGGPGPVDLVLAGGPSAMLAGVGLKGLA